MELKRPFMISSRLLPAIAIGGAVISLNIGDNIPVGSRINVEYFIDFHTFTVKGDDFSVRYQSVNDTFESFFSFLTAFAEAVDFESRTGRKSENSNLFPESMKEWVSENFYEIQELACILEEIK